MSPRLTAAPLAAAQISHIVGCQLHVRLIHLQNTITTGTGAGRGGGGGEHSEKGTPPPREHASVSSSPILPVECPIPIHVPVNRNSQAPACETGLLPQAWPSSLAVKLNYQCGYQLGSIWHNILAGPWENALQGLTVVDACSSQSLSTAVLVTQVSSRSDFLMTGLASITALRA